MRGLFHGAAYIFEALIRIYESINVNSIRTPVQEAMEILSIPDNKREVLIHELNNNVQL